ncbi:uncharacterized protein [Typha latifolia]|uniref:uncharacterized protein n=1 Tax=Typha latifolia TaxID=4733 RepID=UPI003C2D5A44
MITAEKFAADRKRRVCFSFAAYAKEVIEDLRAAGVSIDAGLSEPEFFAIESTYGIVFPPDFRSILREGLPVGPGFPNWRAASPEQIGILLALPSATVIDSASKGSFWCAIFGPQPESRSDRACVARSVLDQAPLLVPVYRHYYLPSSPALAGNPVFSVRVGEVRCSAVDLANFFNRGDGCAVPAWAGKSARRVEVWTEIADGGTCGGRALTRALDQRLVEMGRRLREAGWGEEEVREMRLMGSDGGENAGSGYRGAVINDRPSVIRHVRLLGLTLLRAGWSADDVAESTGWGRD